MSAAQEKPMEPSKWALERAKELSIRSELGESLLHGGVPVEIFSKILDGIAHEFDAIRRERDEAQEKLAEALEAVMQHVYSQNDYTARKYDEYYAAVEKGKSTLAAYRKGERAVRSR